MEMNHKFYSTEQHKDLLAKFWNQHLINKKTFMAKSAKYPHRVIIINSSVPQILQRMAYLINMKIDTFDKIKKTPSKYIIHKYFQGATPELINQAIEQYTAASRNVGNYNSKSNA